MSYMPYNYTHAMQKKKVLHLKQCFFLCLLHGNVKKKKTQRIHNIMTTRINRGGFM